MLLPANNEVREYLNDTLDFARKVNKYDNLIQNLFRLGHGFFQKEYVCILMKDFAPYSFEFAFFNLNDIILLDDKEDKYSNNYILKSEAKCIMNGGLIFHGKHDNGGDGGGPTFSVNLTPQDGWSIHT